MYAIIGLAFSVLLGVMIWAQGITALLWMPLGFAFALFATAQIVLPILMGLPRAIRLVAKRQMRSSVIGRILVTPLIWLVLIFVGGFAFGFIWPSAAESLYNNPALSLGSWLGILAILLSPLSKKGRADFREDFDRSYRRFYTQSAQQKYVDAAITVASNLYLHTIPGAEDAPAPLQFNLPDSRYRYLIFCLSVAASAAPVYDVKEKMALTTGCLNCARWIATEKTEDYLDDPAGLQNSIDSSAAYFRDFLNQWSLWPALEEQGRDEEMIDQICSMIRTTESNEPVEQTDKQRLEQLALHIFCALPTMRRAFVELANR
jgi:hypothetical protein